VKRLSVEFSSRAVRHAEKIADWWRENRPAAPTLFEEEITKAVELVARMPDAGERYLCAVSDMRRLLMPHTSHWLFYSVRPHGLIWVHAVWHTARAKGPRLP
jgi:plasmid stabilization system protein ParE